MQRPLTRKTGRAVGAMLLTAAAVISGCASTGTPVPYGDFKVTRNSIGQPDISGFWTNATLTPTVRPRELGEKLVYSEEEAAEVEGISATFFEESSQATDPDAPADYVPQTSVEKPAQFSAAGGATGGYNSFWLEPGSRVMRVGGVPRTSILTTPDGQIPPRIKGAPAMPRRTMPAGVDSFESYETRSLGERCIIGFGRNGGPPMFANGFYNNNYQIIQAPDHVMILVEMNHDARIIRLNSKHRNDGVRPWFGDSIGWWEGNTLVVETTNIPQEQHFFGSWENLTVTERFTRVAEDRLHYSFTINDPTVWKSPWGGEYEFSPLDGEIFEYACHEGNYALPGILKGARVQEAEAAKAK